jgi:hypothetical protein
MCWAEVDRAWDGEEKVLKQEYSLMMMNLILSFM